MVRPAHVLLIASLFALFAATGLARRHTPSADSRATQASQPRYDYYVMALSWSPTYCQTHPDEHEQCGHRGFGFVLHGLWPQYEHGGGPQRCPSDDRPDRRTVSAVLAFMPSRRLIDHEWGEHGSCTGLDPQAFFELADRAFASFVVPSELKAPREDVSMRADDLRDALRRANPVLREDMLSLHCSQGELVEIRICLDKRLAPRSCGKHMRTGCPVSAPFQIPAAR